MSTLIEESIKYKDDTVPLKVLSNSHNVKNKSLRKNLYKYKPFILNFIARNGRHIAQNLHRKCRCQEQNKCILDDIYEFDESFSYMKDFKGETFINDEEK